MRPSETGLRSLSTNLKVRYLFCDAGGKFWPQLSRLVKVGMSPSPSFVGM